MPHYTVYETTTGVIKYTGFCADIESQAEEGLSVIEGSFSPIEYKVVNGVAKKLPKKEYENKLKEKALRKIRARREKRFAAMSSKLTPLVWEMMTPEKRQEWKDYRQALLDITENFDYKNPVLPDEPSI
jgi:hypothetical protein